MRTKKKKVAVFDIDGTVFRSSLLIEINLRLIREGIFPLKALKEVERSYHRWLDRKGTYEDYINGMVRIHEQHISGKHVSDIVHISRQVVREHRDRVYMYTRDLIKRLRPAYFMIAISGSPIEVVKEFSRFWGFDLYYGKAYEIKDGKYTKRIIQRPYENKKKILYECLAGAGLGLKGSVGVGDTESDISFLEEVEKPICFNPNQKLLATARRRGWKIVVERKDAVHHIV